VRYVSTLQSANITYMLGSLELCPDCVIGLQSKKEIAKGLRVMTKEENFPVLVHCMHGKDRTGLLIMLLLLLCSIEPQVPTPS
jgi:protein tyrosine phosphatase